MKREELKSGREYIATATDGKQYKVFYTTEYNKNGIIFCCIPAYTPDGRKNNFVNFEEVTR